MERSLENGQALIELLVGIFLVLAIFIFTHIASLNVIEDSTEFQFHSTGRHP